MRAILAVIVMLLMLGVACQTDPDGAVVAPQARAAQATPLPVPPPMPKRAIAPPSTKPAGEQVELADGEVKFTLYVPEGWEVPASGNVSIIVHFHGAVWFAIDEHLRHGLDEPLVCFALGEGSSTYARPFKDRECFGRIIRLIEQELAKRSDGEDVTIARVDLSSFSAGYGAVREIVQVPEYVKLIRRIVLADSLYAGWDPATTQPGATSRPARENMDPWTEFVLAAARGEDGKTFVLTHSQVPTPYANTEACAKALIEVVGAEIVPVERGALPATLDPHFPLLYRADKGNFHVWGYGGEDAQAHMTHPRHIAEIWQALDGAERTGGRDEIRRGLSMRDPPEVRQRKHFEQLARKIEPQLKGEASKLDVYLGFFAREIVRDRRLFAWDVAAREQDGKVVLSGVAEYREQVQSLQRLLETLGFTVEQQVLLTPTPHLGDRPYGIVKAPRTFLRARPNETAEVVNEVVADEVVFLLHVSEDKSMYWCHAPDGYVGWISASDVDRIAPQQMMQTLVRRSASEDPRIEAIVASAKSKLGLPYVWGGRSDEGVDCSGLVQTAFASQGIHLPRDAEQQAIVGKLVATRWSRDAIRRGDVLFFLGRRGTVSHTAIYLGDGEFIEAAGKVKISSFDPDHPDYAKGRDEGFCFAKRVIE